MSYTTPYQPMHGPQKEVSHSRMQEILSRNSSNAGQSPKEKSEVKVWPTTSEKPLPLAQAKGPLQWQKPEAGSMGVRTVCERYSCCKTSDGTTWRYEVWTREPLTKGMKQIAVGLPSFEEAKKAAQAHADGTP